ncbi:MAG: thiamine-phosphate kinase [Candidatus Cyclobacteriaceae bacterium M3_2C_046]
MKQKRTELGELGEFGLIEHISKGISHQQKNTIYGIGDDAAVIDTGDYYTIITSDLLTEGVHFDLSYTPLKHLGYKSVVVNLSDVAAMNAVPSQIIVSIGLSNRFSLEAVDELYQGIKAACESYKVDLVGGDTTSSAAGLVISITAIGQVEKPKVVYRKNARVNDIICVTGDLGAAYLGLQVMEREKQAFKSNPDLQPKLEGYNYIVQRQLKPEARTDIIHELAELQLIPSAMIDISDGLASELMHISKNSDISVAIYEDKLPIDKNAYDTAAEFKIDPTTCILNGGEDYELLFTINQKEFEKLKNHPDIHFIGYVQEKDKGNLLVTRNGNVVPIQAQGWKHF